jgi:hypothetical protein
MALLNGELCALIVFPNGRSNRSRVDDTGVSNKVAIRKSDSKTSGRVLEKLVDPGETHRAG